MRRAQQVSGYTTVFVIIPWRSARVTVTITILKRMVAHNCSNRVSWVPAVVVDVESEWLSRLGWLRGRLKQPIGIKEFC